MRDGVSLAGEIRRPALDGVALDRPCPGLVIELTPYVVLRDFYVGEADFFVSRGYVCLVATMRGIGGSGGTWNHGDFRQSGRDAHDLVEWFAAQPYCNGRVGMYGESFGGQTSYGAAVERAPHLRAIAPLQAPSSLYFDVVYPGGIKSTERGELDGWPDIANLTSGGVIDADAEYAANRGHPTFDDFWQDRSFVDQLGDLSVPVLAIGGWNDHYFRSGTLANIEACPHRTWAVYGAWPHFFPVALVDEPAWSTSSDGAQLLAETAQLPPGILLAWFDHWVAGIAGCPVPPEPTFTSFEGPVGVGAGWREIVGGVPAVGRGLRFHLVSDGSLSTEPGEPGSTTFVHPAPAGASGSLTFTNEPLDTDWVLFGHGALTIQASLDATDAALYVEVVEVDLTGNEAPVTAGFLAASHRVSHREPEPVMPGSTDEYCVALRAHHHRFQSGHRIRVRISGGPPALLTPPDQPVAVTVLLDRTATLDLSGHH